MHRSTLAWTDPAHGVPTMHDRCGSAAAALPRRGGAFHQDQGEQLVRCGAPANYIGCLFNLVGPALPDMSTGLIKKGQRSGGGRPGPLLEGRVRIVKFLVLFQY